MRAASAQFISAGCHQMRDAHDEDPLAMVYRLPIWAAETELGDLRGLVRKPQRNLGSASASAMVTASWR